MSVVENMKEVADLVKKFNDIELNRRILNLENEVLDLSREKRRAEEKVEELERTLKLKQDLAFDAPFFWIEKDTTPFCPSCWEDKHKTVHLFFTFSNTETTRFDCPTCKHMYLLDTTPNWTQLKTMT